MRGAAKSILHGIGAAQRTSDSLARISQTTSRCYSVPPTSDQPPVAPLLSLLDDVLGSPPPKRHGHSNQQSQTANRHNRPADGFSKQRPPQASNHNRQSAPQRPPGSVVQQSKPVFSRVFDANTGSFKTVGPRDRKPAQNSSRNGIPRMDASKTQPDGPRANTAGHSKHPSRSRSPMKPGQQPRSTGPQASGSKIPTHATLGPMQAESTNPDLEETVLEEAILPVEDYKQARRSQYKERGSRIELDNVAATRRIPSTPPTKAAPSSRFQQKQKPRAVRKVQARRDVYLPAMVTVRNLARLLNVRIERLQRLMTRSGMSELSSYDHMLVKDDASLLAMELGFNPIIDEEAAFDILPNPPHPNKSELPERPPIVTIMGHVDHGKTTLLDTLRSTSVAKGEAGGITQHIGAFSVPIAFDSTRPTEKRSITFLDTPGHAAFSTMRARGTTVTDIVVLVVAADDGVMPQTKEVINLIKQEPELGVIVAINKVDKPGVDIDRVQKQLMAEGLELEVFGGHIPCVEVSALANTGLDTLVETIAMMAELLEIRVEPKGKAHGFIIESRFQQGLGPVATVLLIRGSLANHDHVICGTTSGRVRNMIDTSGKPVKQALPGTAVVVSGWKELPEAGEEVLTANESDIRKALANRERRKAMVDLIEDAEAINEQRQADRKRREKEELLDKRTNRGILASAEPVDDGKPQVRELRLVIKADVSGSAEAVEGALEAIGNHQARVKIVHTGVGDVAMSDVDLAKTAGGLVVAFSVKAPRDVASSAANQKVDIVSSPIIYRLMESVKEKVIALLPPTIEKKVTGEATVMELFSITVKGEKKPKIVAGSRSRNGTILKKQDIRVVRNGQTIYEGPVDSLKHHKQEVQEIGREMDFGLALKGFEGVRAGDLLQSIQVIELPGKL